ncbi:hypothetical protein ABZ484_28865, partial [Streptomyces sp. NPDC006393]|uniref:NACHT domain-containing protein n=1 Tax=Streptomyces sp. NPDC006393 TaxID=3156763 RepID=UPI0033D41ABC
MSEAAEPASGREALAAKLGELQAKLRRLGKTQKAAVEEANRHRREAAGRPPDVPWPRREGGKDLSLQAVNDWFRTGSKEPSVPQDFDDLWAVVAVMLRWTEELRDKPSTRVHRQRWKDLHAEAQRRESLDEQVRGYLNAAGKTAEQHPNAGIADQAATPPLAEVYVRQHSQPTGRDEQRVYRDDAPAAGTGEGPVAVAEPAEALFRKTGRTDRMCVLIAGPGIGKSTLLRTRLREAAAEWLDPTGSARRTPVAVPVWVSARALVDEQEPIAESLAAATRSLSRYGRNPALDADRFLRRPCAGAHWQLLVDGLDELPNADQRRAVLDKLAYAVTEDPPLYRCVVATRPLADHELDILDRVLGHQVPRYDLQPFTPGDLHTYTEKYFATRWPPEEAGHRARQFTRALRDASLAELARTPLMASMLCQLHLSHPDRPLPKGRTEVYEDFTYLVYEHNQGKRVADSHGEAIKHLVEGHQSPQAKTEAEAAARQVHEHLYELIDYLAHRWLTGHPAPAAAALAEHPAVPRPGKVRAEVWDAFLEGLLRHTGLLVQHPDGLGFPHQTFLEYHAARHATRNEQGRRRTLHQLFDADQAETGWQDQEPSYLGFLLDRLLNPEDQISEDTKARLEDLTTFDKASACRLLAEQVRLRTRLPSGSTAHQLTRLANDTTLQSRECLIAAEALAMVEGYVREAGRLLTALADGTTLDRSDRVRAAKALAELDGHAEDAARILTTLANDTTLPGDDRVSATQALGELDGHGEDAARTLTTLANDTTLPGDDRVSAAQTLGELDGHGEDAARALTTLANDTRIPSYECIWAAEALGKLDGHTED